jgi:DNA-binding response OmpR family regulator
MEPQRIDNDDKNKAKKTRVLLVDDTDDLREVIQVGLESQGFEVVAAASVTEALKYIVDEKFDVLISDLHMPNAGDGFSVVTAMHHLHPSAVTIILSGLPETKASMAAILIQADEILMKPFGLKAMTDLIRKRLSNPVSRAVKLKERVAEILERETARTIQTWMARVDRSEDLGKVQLSDQDRMGHLPVLLRDVVGRLRLPPVAEIPISAAARQHGILRNKQGYTVAMIVEESQILQVSIFNTLQQNLQHVDISTVLLDVMMIADEVDSQLKQAVLGFMEPMAPRMVGAYS